MNLEQTVAALLDMFCASQSVGGVGTRRARLPGRNKHLNV